MFYLDFEEKLENLDIEKKSLIRASQESGLDVNTKLKAIEEKELLELKKYTQIFPRGR